MRLILFFIFFSSLSFLIAQSNKSDFIIMSLEESKGLEKRASTYDKCIFIADSLLLEYNKHRFHLKTETKNEFYGGLTFILSLYNKAKGDNEEDDFLQGKITSLVTRLTLDSKKSIEFEYQKVVDKAEECFNNKNYEKAYELYSRAHVFVPSDKNNKKKMKALKKLIKKKK